MSDVWGPRQVTDESVYREILLLQREICNNFSNFIATSYSKLPSHPGILDFSCNIILIPC
jgi:hypothetical protein